jgi:hypothetical protein
MGEISPNLVTLLRIILRTIPFSREFHRKPLFLSNSLKTLSINYLGSDDTVLFSSFINEVIILTFKRSIQINKNKKIYNEI